MTELVNRNFLGVWIPKEIWLNEELTLIEKAIITEISSLDNKNHCYATNEYLAKFCNCSTSTVTRAINNLKNLGYIEIVSFNGRNRVVKMTNLINMTMEPNQNDQAAYSKRLANNIDNNLDNNLDIYIAKKDNDLKTDSVLGKESSINVVDTGYSEDLSISAQPEKAKATKERKKKESYIPSLEEVIEYSIENGMGEEFGKKFFDYYNSLHWLDTSGRHIKSWKHKFQTWKLNNKDNSNRSSGGSKMNRRDNSESVQIFKPISLDDVVKGGKVY